MVSAVNVDNNILQKRFNTKTDITLMKLQKLIYLVFKKYYQDTQTILFPERFEVWKYGPVVRSIYNEFKKYGGNVIKEYGKELEQQKLDFKYTRIKFEKNKEYDK